MTTESRARAFDPHCPECLGTGMTVVAAGGEAPHVVADCLTCARAWAAQVEPTLVRTDGILRGNADLEGA